jgi:hypothetical protein
MVNRADIDKISGESQEFGQRFRWCTINTGLSSDFLKVSRFYASDM